MNRIQKSLLGLAAMLGLSVASFGGLIGENYVLAGAGYSTVRVSGISNPDGLTAVVGANYNAMREANFAADIRTSYSHTRLNSSGFNRWKNDTFLVGAVLFTEVDNMKPFFGVDLGWTWDRWRTAGSDNSWVYSLSTGVEVAITETFSLTPSISWNRAEDYSDDYWAAQLAGHQWINDQLGVGASYSITEGPNRVHSLMATVTFRY